MSRAIDRALRRAHDRRHELLAARRLGRPGWDAAEYERIRETVDELEAAWMGLRYWRWALIWRLNARHFDLTIEWARTLLGELLEPSIPATAPPSPGGLRCGARPDAAP